MAEKFNLGPSFLLVNNGNPATDTDWVIALTQDVTVNAENVAAFRQGAFVGVELMQGASLPSKPTVAAQLLDMQLSLLKEFFIGGSVVSSGGYDSVALPDTLQFLSASDFPSLAIIPLDQAGDGVDAELAFWLPSAYIQGPSGWGWTRPEDGSDPVRRYNLNIMGVIDESIVSTARAGFWGPPGAHSLSWAIPTLNTAAIG